MRSFVLCLTAVLIPLALNAGPDGHATVNREAVPVHAEASTSSAVVRVLAKGDELKVGFSLATSEGEWCSATGGYVLCRYLTREEAAKPELEDAPLPPVFTTSGPTTKPGKQTAYFAPREPALLTPEQSALMSAARLGSVVAIQVALEKGADANASNKFGQTPLMFAVALNDTAAARMLLEADADMNARDAAGRSVLINAALAGGEHVAPV